MRRSSKRRVAAFVLLLVTILIGNLIGHSRADTVDTFAKTVEFTVSTPGSDSHRTDNGLRTDRGDHCSLHNCAATSSAQANRLSAVASSFHSSHPKLRSANQASLFRPPIRSA